MQKNPESYTWDSNLNRYRKASTGRPLSTIEFNRIFDRAVVYHEKRTASLITAYFDGDISKDTFINSMRYELKTANLQLSYLQAGGRPQMTPSQYGRIGGRLSDDYRRINNLADNIEEGTASLGQALNRGNMYIGSGRNVAYLNAATPTPTASGVWIERRRLNPAEHCDDCIGYYQQGWQLYGTLPRPGAASACLSNCKCTMLIKLIPRTKLNDYIGTKRR